MRSDLWIMADNPLRFLNDIPMIPLRSLRIHDKLYWTRTEEDAIELSHQERTSCGSYGNVIITGGTNMGKSKLAMHMWRLLCRLGCYIL